MLILIVIDVWKYNDFKAQCVRVYVNCVIGRVIMGDYVI